MAHKTLTISEEAYKALSRLKSHGDSFTDVILRLTTRSRKGSLLDYARSLERDDELAETLDEIIRDRERTRIRSVKA